MVAEDFVCPKCTSTDGEWFDCEHHRDTECYVLRCDDCDYFAYDHDEEEEK